MQKLINYLQSIAGGTAVVRKDAGLCSHVEAQTNSAEHKAFDDAMQTVCRTWKHYSGDELFPVRPQRKVAAWLAFSKAGELGTMWNGEYGRRRRELAGLIAEELRKCKN